MFKCQSNDRCVYDLDLLDFLLEFLAVVLVPKSYLDVKDIVAQVLNVLQMLLEHLLEVEEGNCPFLAFGATEYGHLSERELQLAFANFF